MRCRNCGEEVEEGRNFCPHCGKPVAAGEPPVNAGPAAPRGAGERRDASAAAPGPPPAVPMPSFERGRGEADGTRRAVFIAAAVVALALLAGLAWWATRPRAVTPEERLEGALRPGSPEFEEVRDRLVMEFDPDEHATIGANALGNFVVTMRPTVRNFTGRTVSGLEFHAAGFDLSGNAIREKTFAREQEIEPNRTSDIPLSLNFPQDNRPARLKLDLTGVKFK